MTSREIEKLILKKFKELDKRFNIYILNDLKSSRVTKAPYIISNCYLMQTLNIFNKKLDNGAYKQFEEQEHSIRFTFLLNDNLSFDDVNNLRMFLNHEQGVRYWLLREGHNLVINNITDIKNLTENRTNEIVKKYSFDVDVKVVREYQVNIDVVQKVDFEIEEVITNDIRSGKEDSIS